MRHLPNAVAAVLAICALASPYGARAATFVLEGPWPSRAASPVGRNYSSSPARRRSRRGPAWGRTSTGSRARNYMTPHTVGKKEVIAQNSGRRREAEQKKYNDLS
jgi:hypothetical protein